jgi:hypothetical protein
MNQGNIVGLWLSQLFWSKVRFVENRRGRPRRLGTLLLLLVSLFAILVLRSLLIRIIRILWLSLGVLPLLCLDWRLGFGMFSRTANFVLTRQ